MDVQGLELERVGLIRTVSIHKDAGRHTTCRVELLVLHTDEIPGLTRKIGTRVRVGNGDRIYLIGILERVSGTSSYQKTALTLDIISTSITADRLPGYRVFQSPDKTGKQVAQRFSSAEQVVEILDAPSADAILEQVLFQDGETDFSFWNRYAAEHGMYLFVDDTDERQAHLSLGECKDRRLTEVEAKEIRAVEFSVSEAGSTLRLETTRYFDVGKLRVDGAEYAVLSVRIEAADGMERFSYRLSGCPGKKQAAPPDKTGVASAGRGRVISCQDPQHLGRLQVELLDVEDCVTGERRWIPFTANLTDSSGGVLFYPAPNELVQVSCWDGELYATGCVRQEAIVSAEGLERSHAIQFGDTRAVFEPDRFFASAGQFSVEIKDGVFRAQSGKASIALEPEEISIVSGQNVRVEAEGQIGVRSGPQIDIKADQQISVQAGRQASLTAEKIVLAGTGSIVAETKTFDVR